MNFSESGEPSLSDIPEAVTAFRACYDEYGPDHALTTGLATIFTRGIEEGALPEHPLTVRGSELVVNALKRYCEKPNIDSWQTAQAAYMLELVFSQANSLQ